MIKILLHFSSANLKSGHQAGHDTLPITICNRVKCFKSWVIPKKKSSTESSLDFNSGFFGYEVESFLLNMFVHGLHVFSLLKLCVLVSMIG